MTANASGGYYLVVDFVDVSSNTGNGYVQVGNVYVFKAPKEGIYKFSLRLFAFGDRTIIGLATYPSMVKRSMVWVKGQTSAVITTMTILAKDEMVAPVYNLENESNSSGDVDPKSSALNEFSGELIGELCGGKPC